MKERIIRALELPEDVVYDLPKITLIGDIQFYMENHRGIISYAPVSVRIAVSIGELEIKGENLTIRNISRDELHLEGRIQSIHYSR